MSKSDNIPVSAFEIVTLDTLIALFAGIAIFTAVFATGMRPDSGPGLIFYTLPVVFTKMPGGYIFSILFFILLTIAALTSAISLLEVITAYFVDEKGWSRKKAVLVFGTVTFLIGLPSALSYNVLSDFRIFGRNFFDSVDFLSANILLPLGGLLISLFVGYFWKTENAVESLKEGAEGFFNKFGWFTLYWKIFIKYFAPVVITVIFLKSIGII